jgi:multisubunit Na+/H+ antiporter MnhC subunit
MTEIRRVWAVVEFACLIMFFPYMVTRDQMFIPIVGFGVGSTLVTLAIITLGYDKD